MSGSGRRDVKRQRIAGAGSARADFHAEITPAGGITFYEDHISGRDSYRFALPVEARLPLLRFLLEDAQARGEYPRPERGGQR